MKYAFTIACCLFLASSAQAQFQRGDSFVTGSIGIETGDNLPFVFAGNGTSFTLAPGFGHFLSDRFALVLSAGYRSTSTDFISTRFFNFRPSLRYYKEVSTSFGLWLDFGPDLTIGSSTRDVSANDQETFDILAFSMDFRPGIYYFLGERFALEASIGSLGYLFVREEARDTDLVSNRHGFSASLQSSIGGSIGLSYFFGRGGRSR